jgi:uncharacterized surface protein with fasciclin (FAS1) repeats
MLKRTMVAGACLMLAACGDGGAGNEAGAAGAAGAPANPSASGKASPGKASLLDGLTGSADHATLVNAVKAAGLTETLSGAQPYTLFAPNEAAFAKLPPGTAQGLLDPEARGQLTALLTNHIVPGWVTAEDLGRAIERGKGKAQLATVGGASLSFSREGDAIVVADAKGGRGRVAGAATPASNGVIHSIDTVMMPQ